MNRLTVIGRIVRDVELRTVGGERMVLNNTLAVPRSYRTEQGQEADFINFVAWGKRAELIEEYTNKGDLIGLDGRIQSRNYQNEEKQTVYVVEMVVDTVHFLQTRRRSKVSAQKNNQKEVRQEEKNQNDNPTSSKEEVNSTE